MKDKFCITLLGLSFVCSSVSFFSVKATLLSYGLFAFFIYLKRPLISCSRVFFLTFVFLLAFPLLFTSPNEIYFNYYLKYMLYVIYFSLLIFLFRGGKLKFILHGSLNLFLFIHLTAFYIQVLVYLSFGEYVDFNNLVRDVGSDSLYLTKALEGYTLNIRGTGLFSEPSFYSMSILPIAYFMLYQEKSLLVILAFISAFLSLSIAAIIIAILLILIYLYKSKGGYLFKMLTVISIIFSSGFLLDFFDARVSNSSDYDAVGSRVAIFDEFSVRGDYLNSFGAGFFEEETKPFGVTNLYGAQTRDSSFLIYLFYVSGWVGTLYFIIVLALITKLSNIMIFAPLLLFKFHFVFGGFWLLLFLMVIYTEREQ